MLYIDIVYTMKQRDDRLIDTFTQVMADDRPELGESKKKYNFSALSLYFVLISM